MDLYDKAQKDQEEDPAFGSTHHYYEMTREEVQLNWMRKLHHVLKTKDHKMYLQTRPATELQWNWTHQGQPPVGLHLSMFMESMHMFTTEDQKKKWLPKCENMDIIGCYAQTEIGHGSNVAGLETTSTFD